MDWHHIFSCPSQWIRTKDRSTVQTRHCKLIYQRHYVLRSIYKVLTSATRLTFRSLSLRVARNSLMTLLSRGSMGWGWSVIVNLTAVTTVALVSAESEATTMSRVNNVTELVINYKTLKCKYTPLLIWVKKSVGSLGLIIVYPKSFTNTGLHIHCEILWHLKIWSICRTSLNAQYLPKDKTDQCWHIYKSWKIIQFQTIVQTNNDGNLISLTKF